MHIYEENYKIREVERAIFANPEVVAEDYPLLSENEMFNQDMEGLAYKYDYLKTCCVFAYAREWDASWFADIYAYYWQLGKGIIKERFVIAKGKQMSIEKETSLLRILYNPYAVCNTQTMSVFYERMKELAPELHLKDYKDYAMFLAHVYFGSFRSGFREILWKAGGLESIGMNLDSMDYSWNIVANNIEEAFEMPINLLRKINTNDAIRGVLDDTETLEKAKVVYKKYHTLLNDVNSLNKYQILYLFGCAEKSLPGDMVDKKMLQTTLASIDDEWCDELGEYVEGSKIYNDYMEYISIIDEIGCKIFPRYPDFSNEESTEEFYNGPLFFIHLYEKDGMNISMMPAVEKPRYCLSEKNASRLYR